MTRFKELKRIEDAIKYKDEKAIHWALSYCKSRLELAHRYAYMKKQIKHWEKLIDKLNDTIESDNQFSN